MNLHKTLFTLALATLVHTSAYAMETGGAIASHGVEKKASTTVKTAVAKSKIYYGKVLEIHDAMGYKYLKVDEEGTQLWVAIANAPVAIGEKVGYDKNTVMKDFESKTLKRKFKEVIFASEVYLTQKPKKPSSMKEMLGLTKKDPHQGMGKGMSPQKDEKPAKPFVKKDVYSIEEIHMWRKSLEGQTLTIKAKVYKVSKHIMKLNWVHLGDGSGNEKKLTDDLVFTASSSEVKAGDSVIATGKVVVNKDFGFGYFYPVLIQEATFKVQ